MFRTSISKIGGHYNWPHFLLVLMTFRLKIVIVCKYLIFISYDNMFSLTTSNTFELFLINNDKQTFSDGLTIRN